MIRYLFTGFVLVVGVAAAALWLMAPGCEGAFCLRAEVEAEVRAATREPAPREQVTAEDLERIWREAESVRSKSEAVESQVEQIAVAPVVQDASQEAPDPEDPALMLEAAGDTPEELDLASQQWATADPAAAERWAELAEAALSEWDPELRGDAVHAVGLRRNVDSVAVLIEVATDDPEPDNRYQALQLLWYSAADGLDEDGAIRRTLEAALGDDEDIAELAEQALADLAKLEQANN